MELTGKTDITNLLGIRQQNLQSKAKPSLLSSPSEDSNFQDKLDVAREKPSSVIDKLDKKDQGELDSVLESKRYNQPIGPRNPVPQPKLPSDRGVQGAYRKAVDAEELKSKNQTNSPITEDKVDDLNKRAALQNFIKRMKDEFGLNPTDIMAAFASLNIEQLALPPQENIDKIVEALPIAEEDRGLAKQIVLEMLVQTESKNFADSLKSSGRQLSLDLMSKREMQKQVLDQSLAQMTQNFFQPPVTPQNVLQNQNPNEKNADGKNTLSEFFVDGSSEELGAGGLSQSLGELSQPTSATTASTPANAAQMAVNQMPADQEALVEESLVEEPNVGEDNESSIFEKTSENKSDSKTILGYGLGAAALTKMVESPKSQAVPVSDIDWTKFQINKTDKPSAQQSDANADSSKNSSDMQLSSAEGIPAEAGNFDTLMTQAEAPKAQTSIQGAPAMFAETQATGSDNAVNMKEVISKAQILIDKGGGEMKISLSPEGLGDMKMKISVKDGQVAVQMVTETQDAKKLIEKGLGELKATLAAHKLNVDLIKVDTAADISHQLDKQYDEAGRQSAQQFLEQFRQDNSEWRRGFFDIAGAKMYKSQTRDSSDNGNLHAQPTPRRKDVNRRLDLVA